MPKPLKKKRASDMTPEEITAELKSLTLKPIGNIMNGAIYRMKSGQKTLVRKFPGGSERWTPTDEDAILGCFIEWQKTMRVMHRISELNAALYGKCVRRQKYV